MSTEPPRRRGRRDNGLDAPAYVPLADVDPRIGEYLLDVLWAAGVPAYLEPPTAGAPARAATTPTSPLDRLWVDRELRAVARSIVEAEAPGLPDQGDRAHSPARMIPEERAGHAAPFNADEEAAWRSLVAQLEGPSDDGPSVNPWPTQEDLLPRPAEEGRDGEVDDRSSGVLDPRRQRKPADPAPFDNLLDAIDSIDTSPEEGHYEPPLPPPVPHPSRHTWLALSMIAIGTLLVLVPQILDGGGPAVFAIGVLLIIAGAGALVWRLRTDHDDPDDGAVV